MAQLRPHCGHIEYQTTLQKKYPGLQKSIQQLEHLIAQKKFLREPAQAVDEASYTIPVVFHVIYKNSAQNIPEDKIYSQLSILNEDYQSLNKDTINIPEEFKNVQGKMKIQFCLATRDALGRVSSGINRISTTRPGFDINSNYDDSYLKGLSYWPSDQYLNIWVVDIIDNYLGYSTFPTTSSLSDLNYAVPASLDGVVLSYKAVGNNPNSTSYNKGRSATHEIGHWLGLYHNWGDAPCGDDLVDDTPLQDSSNLSMRPNNCVHYSYCKGLVQLDMANNYMDYSPDACMNMFTRGQCARVSTVMTTAPRRMALKNSLGCFEPVSFASIPRKENFDSGTLSPADTAGNSKTRLRWELVNSGRNKYHLKCANTSNNNGDSIFYTTPYLDFTPIDNPVLEIDLSAFANERGRTDSVVFSFSPNERQVFKIKSLYGSSLTTLRAGSVLPDSSWRTFRIDLRQLAKRYIAQIKITFYSKGISDIRLDNIRLYNNLNQHEIKLYPQPAREKITAAIAQDEYDSMTFEIINALGKVMRTWTVAKDKLEEEIPLLNLSVGLYFLRTTFLESNQIRVAKFVVE